LVWEVGKEYIFFLDDVLEEISLKDKKIKKWSKGYELNARK
jgi:hypothetical protein